eukprot:PhM_4_TR5624/c0_g1_i2/m.62018/K04739/PRKAR; cAMP-dependent protein kinase regulator
MSAVEAAIASPVPKAEDHIADLRAAIDAHPILSLLSQRERDALVASGFYVCLHPGEVLLELDDDADNAYVTTSGAVDVTTEDGSTTTFPAGALVGELALMDPKQQQATRMATVSASLSNQRPVEAFGIPRVVFLEVVVPVLASQRALHSDVVMTLPALVSVPRYVKACLCDALQVCNLGPRSLLDLADPEVVLPCPKNGDRNDDGRVLIIVCEGRVEVVGRGGFELLRGDTMLLHVATASGGVRHIATHDGSARVLVALLARTRGLHPLLPGMVEKNCRQLK